MNVHASLGSTQAERIGKRRILIAHPHAELYGSDRMALESVTALVNEGWDVVVALPENGPLFSSMAATGASVIVVEAPVLRKSLLSGTGLWRLAVHSTLCARGMLRALRQAGPDVVYVSTVTMPMWLLLARLTRARVVCHVHEAEAHLSRPLRLALAAPLVLAHEMIANSRSTRQVLLMDLPFLRRRVEVIYNGVPGPDHVVAARTRLVDPLRLIVIGRVSPRKGTDIAIAALGRLRQLGVSATLDIVGGVFDGYEWFEESLREQVREANLDEVVRWRGVLPDVWPALAGADIALVPSWGESFGNVAVEAMLAGRPVIVTDRQGLCEIVRPGENGDMVPAGDPDALAQAISRMAADWPTARRRAERASTDAGIRYAPTRYREDLAQAMNTLVGDEEVHVRSSPVQV